MLYDAPLVRPDWSHLDINTTGRPDWTAIRAGYDAGESAPVLAGQHGVSVSAIRTKARQQHWRRADAPLRAVDVSDPDLLEARPALQLAETAWKLLSDAVEGGRLVEAVGWFRMHRELRGEALNVGQALRCDASQRQLASYRPPVLDPAGHPGATPAPGGDVHGLHGLHADVHVQIDDPDGSRPPRVRSI